MERVERIEASAETVEVALELALRRLSEAREEELTQDDVEVEVLSRGKAGILGLGAEKARVRVSLRARPEQGEADVAALGRQTLERLLELMGVEATVRLKAASPEDAGSPTVAFDISGDDLGILIGRRGDTLASLQYLVNLMVSRQLKAQAGIVLDVEGYRERRYQALQALAERIAARVKATGRPFSLEPMPANERRIIHLALRDSPDVVTESAGEGESRKITIFPKRLFNREELGRGDKG